jgi:PhnB protein
MLGSPIREGFHTVTPYLIVPDVDKFIGFLQKAFGGTETFRAPGSAGGIHVEVKIGDSTVMIGGGVGRNGQSLPAMLHLYVENAAAVYQNALQAGATSLGAPEDKGDGDRRGGVRDLFGNEWYISTHLND